jgi:hypothetical protein
MIHSLYVKQHNTTGLKYFGKTIRDPLKYKGSGDYWKRHLQKYGNNVSTINVWQFNDQAACRQFAVDFSKDNDIVKSEKWANLIEEDGINFPPNSKGKPKSQEHKIKIGLANKGNKRLDLTLYNQQNKKGKSLEELYGNERASQIREKRSMSCKGKCGRKKGCIPWNKGKKLNNASSL